VPVYIHTFAFPPSYFHRVVRTVVLPGGREGDPAAHIDFAPWGAQIAQSVRLLQDKVKADAPSSGAGGGGQGAGRGHTLVRWVHRARFAVRPRAAAGRIPITDAPSAYAQLQGGTGTAVVDEGWYGTVVLETEGTNEGLEDLLGRVGYNAANGQPIHGWRTPEAGDPRRMYRILRERR
jgi:hypothetical protein